MEVEFGKAGTPDPRLFPAAKPEKQTKAAPKKSTAKKSQRKK